MAAGFEAYKLYVTLQRAVPKELLGWVACCRGLRNYWEKFRG